MIAIAHNPTSVIGLRLMVSIGNKRRSPIMVLMDVKQTRQAFKRDCELTASRGLSARGRL
jgi:hypothetical protein